jgi:hypothetical protein
MVDVVFSKEIDFKSANVCVLVADETGKNFVSEKFKCGFRELFQVMLIH